jgi:hypothetical protein
MNRRNFIIAALVLGSSIIIYRSDIISLNVPPKKKIISYDLESSIDEVYLKDLWIVPKIFFK